jgi:hypothetical protein
VIPLPAEHLEERLRAALRQEVQEIWPSPDSWERLQRRARLRRSRQMAGGTLGLALLLAIAVLAWTSLHAHEPEYLVGPSPSTTITAPGATSSPTTAVQNLELTIAPTTVRRGDTIQVAPRSPCVPPAGAPRPTVSVWIIDSAGNDLGISRFPVNPDGTWLAAYSVGSWAARGEATVHARCRPDAGPDSSDYASYGGVPITLAD